MYAETQVAGIFTCSIRVLRSRAVFMHACAHDYQMQQKTWRRRLQFSLSRVLVCMRQLQQGGLVFILCLFENQSQNSCFMATCILQQVMQECLHLCTGVNNTYATEHSSTCAVAVRYCALVLNEIVPMKVDQDTAMYHACHILVVHHAIGPYGMVYHPGPFCIRRSMSFLLQCSC